MQTFEIIRGLERFNFYDDMIKEVIEFLGDNKKNDKKSIIIDVEVKHLHTNTKKKYHFCKCCNIFLNKIGKHLDSYFHTSRKLRKPLNTLSYNDDYIPTAREILYGRNLPTRFQNKIRANFDEDFIVYIKDVKYKYNKDTNSVEEL